MSREQCHLHEVCVKESTRDVYAGPCRILCIAKLSINLKSGASRLVVVVECSPHVAKLPQITSLFCACSQSGPPHPWSVEPE